MLLPLLLLLTMLVVQAGLWFHAQALVKTAANKGVDAARVQEGSAAEGHATAAKFLESAGVLRDPNIGVHRGPETARVTVSGEVVSLLFGVPMSVTGTADAPVERTLP